MNCQLMMGQCDWLKRNAEMLETVVGKWKVVKLPMHLLYTSQEITSLQNECDIIKHTKDTLL